MTVKEPPLGLVEKQSLRERQRQDRNESILQAAFDLMATHGYDAFTMDALADRVGISRQTLYHHFSSKEDIVLRAVLALVEEGIASIKAIDTALSPVQRLERVLRWMMEIRFSPSRAAFVKIRPALIPIKMHPDYRRAFDRRAEVIGQIVEAAQAAGEIQANMPSGLIVHMLLSITCDPSYDDLIEAGKASPAGLVEDVVDFFFRGIRPNESR